MKKHGSYISRLFSVQDYTSLFNKLPTRDKHPITNQAVIYVYYGDKAIYIGQTKDFNNRHNQHVSDPSFYIDQYTDVIVIYGSLIDKNSLDDIEKKLITLFIVDNTELNSSQKKYTVNNKTGGNHSIYYENNQDVLAKIVIPFWREELYNAGIVHNPDISSLKESLLYKYSPFKSLSLEQHSIVEQILCSNDHSVIYGYAGTGKTVLFTNLIARYSEAFPNKRIGAVAKPNWVKSAKKIFDAFNLHDTDSNLIVGSSYQIINNAKDFDIIIVDEAHSLEWDYPKKSNVQKHIYTDEHNNRLALLLEKTNQLVLMYDEFQISRPSHIPLSMFDEFIEEHSFDDYRLYTQFRINIDNREIDYTSIDYFNGLLHVLELNTINTPPYNANVFLDKSDDDGDPYFGVVESIEELFDYINHESNRNSSTVNRVVSGYYKKWLSKTNKHSFDWTIDTEGVNKKWNSTYESWITKNNSVEEIGSIFAIQGVDLNYVGVIIGDDLSVVDGKLVGNKKFHYDNLAIPTNVEYKNNSNEASQRFTNYIKNAYYILLTRGIDGVRVFFTDLEVQKHVLDKIQSNNTRSSS